jgi:hypothetical protein
VEDALLSARRKVKALLTRADVDGHDRRTNTSLQAILAGLRADRVFRPLRLARNI